MNKTVELVNLWAEYENKHDHAEITDFCRYILIQEREKAKVEVFSGTALPPDNFSKLAKIIGRVSRLHNAYAIIALKECGLSSIDEFIYLNDIHFSGKSQKTKVIYSNFNELSSGLLILERLKKKKLIAEEDNTDDKRSKNVIINTIGEQVLFACYEKLEIVNRFFFDKMTEDDVVMSIRLLSATEVEFSNRWIADKSKSLEELF
ncbi:MAG: MarR family winged helix-turn-helix transcriptional regulator [Ginsengibacter sp.]